MYERLTDKLEKIMDWIARHVLLAVFSVIFVLGLFIKAMYAFDDTPYFTLPTVYDLLAAIIVIALFVLVYKKRKWLQAHMNYKICAVIFFAAAVLFVVLVPLKPFSDMQSIYEGALKFSKFQWDEFVQDDYWSRFPGNMKLAVFWGVLLIPFPKCLMTFKVWNMVFLYLTAVLCRNLAKEYGVRYYNLVYLFILTFSPLFLYVNHVYYDLPVLFLLMLAVYIYKKTDRLIPAFLVMGLARYLRKNATIFVLAFIIIYVFEHRDMFRKRRWVRDAGRLLIAVALFFVTYKGLMGLTDAQFHYKDYQSYSGWNQFYIGLNEEKFGFMDGDFSYDRTADDVIARIEEYGPVRLTKIIVKKTFWLWTQGTYQAQRYAFGSDVTEWSEKFEYETFLTSHLLNDEQTLRKLINSFMRAQYYVLFGLMILTMLRKKDVGRFRLFYYIIIATFLSLLVYELKSRYILQLIPFMVIMAGNSLELIENRKKRK